MLGLRGCYPILPTPFGEESEIDQESVVRLVHHLEKAELPGFTMFGLASEFYKLDDRERDLLIDLVLAQRKAEQTTVIVSVTAHSWEVARKQARRAEAAGADALMLLPPFFLQPSREDVHRHILEVASAVSLPIVVQYSPAQTGGQLAAEFFAKLNERAQNIRYVKVESQPPGPMISAIMEESDGKVECLVGYGGLGLPDALSRGAVGVQPGSGIADYYPHLLQRYDAGDTEGAYALYRDLLPLVNLLMQGIEPLNRLEKVLLRRRGIISCNYCRGVGYEADERMMDELERFMQPVAGWLHPSAPWRLENSPRGVNSQGAEIRRDT